MIIIMFKSMIKKLSCVPCLFCNISQNVSGAIQVVSVFPRIRSYGSWVNVCLKYVTLNCMSKAFQYEHSFTQGISKTRPTRPFHTARADFFCLLKLGGFLPIRPKLVVLLECHVFIKLKLRHRWCTCSCVVYQ